jgi:hypothetical protein
MTNPRLSPVFDLQYVAPFIQRMTSLLLTDIFIGAFTPLPSIYILYQRILTGKPFEKL